MIFERVISVCISKDLPVWKVTSRKLLEHIPSRSYSVIVPDSEVSAFRQHTPAEVDVVPESFYLPTVLQLLREQFPADLSYRAGWYLQQFLKIEAIRSDPRDCDCLIWDADTVPVRRLEFWDDEQRFILRTGIHQPAIHPPYFSLISSLFGIERKFDTSFISQCFPVRSRWIREMCDQLARKHHVDHWFEPVVNYVVEHPSPCGFSEYETIGLWVLENYCEDIVLQDGNYFRPANNLFPLENIDVGPVSLIKDSIDYLAYDNYNQTVYGGLNVGCGDSRITNQTFDGKSFVNVDKIKTSGSDLILDLNKPLPFLSNQFSQIVAHNILEHVDNLLDSIAELDRVLAPGGILQIEVPHIGSYNHGTDVTHIRGLTFDSFNFLLYDTNYLFPRGGNPFRYNLVSFNREVLVDNRLVRQVFDHIPQRGSYTEWIQSVLTFKIPGTFGFVFRKRS